MIISLGIEGAGHLASRWVICSGCDHHTRWGGGGGGWMREMVTWLVIYLNVQPLIISLGEEGAVNLASL